MNFIRRAVMRLMRNRVVARALPNGRQVFVSPDAQLKYLRRGFDEDLVRLAETIAPNSVVWDVGANCGVFAFSCDPSCDVLGIEADPFLASLLRRSAANSNVRVLERAIASQAGRVAFSIAANGRASNHLASVPGYSMAGGERERIEVAATTLDQLLEAEPAPAFIKIDVEGAEIEVLTGADRVLSEARPTLYLEVGEDTRDACEAILKRHDYIWEQRSGMNWLCTPVRRVSGAHAMPNAARAG